jgi:hypothetical protein
VAGDGIAAARAFVGGLVVDAGDVLRELRHVLHVGDAGAGVLGGDVAAVQLLERACERGEQLGRLVRARVADDHRLATAQLEVGHRRLVGHAARQAQHVAHRLLLAGIRPHAAAAERGAELGIVDGDDRLQSALVVADEDHLLVVGKVAQGKYGHAVSPSFGNVGVGLPADRSWRRRSGGRLKREMKWAGK